MKELRTTVEEYMAVRKTRILIHHSGFLASQFAAMGTNALADDERLSIYLEVQADVLAELESGIDRFERGGDPYSICGAADDLIVVELMVNRTRNMMRGRAQ